MQIQKILAIPGTSTYYYEDVSYLQNHAVPLAERYQTPSLNPDFKFLREPGEIVSIGLVTDLGVFWGDCVSVVYGGKAGRKSVFRSADGIREIKETLARELEGYRIESFKKSCEELTSSLSLPVAYGLSQALLSAQAKKTDAAMAEVICREWDLPLPKTPVALHGSSRDRYAMVDKMMVRQVESFPHLLVDDIEEQLGKAGEKIISYIKELSGRAQKYYPKDLLPTLHFDFHGAIAKIFDFDMEKIVSFVLESEKEAKPFRLRMESLAILNSREDQIEWSHAFKRKLTEKNSTAQLVVDEWANTYEDILAFATQRACDMIQIKTPDLGSIHHSIQAVLECKKNSIQSLLGGSCNETMLSATLTTHIGLATQPTCMMVKPGMGFDEGFALIKNEMTRTLAILS